LLAGCTLLGDGNNSGYQGEGEQYRQNSNGAPSLAAVSADTRTQEGASCRAELYTASNQLAGL
jgi:hypothetical protein